MIPELGEQIPVYEQTFLTKNSKDQKSNAATKNRLSSSSSFPLTTNNLTVKSSNTCRRRKRKTSSQNTNHKNQQSHTSAYRRHSYVSSKSNISLKRSYHNTINNGLSSFNANFSPSSKRRYLNSNLVLGYSPKLSLSETNFIFVLNSPSVSKLKSNCISQSKSLTCSQTVSNSSNQMIVSGNQMLMNANKTNSNWSGVCFKHALYMTHLPVVARLRHYFRHLHIWQPNGMY